MTDTADTGGLLAGESIDSADEATTPEAGVSVPHIDQPTSPNLSAEIDDDPLERPDYWPEKFWVKDKNEPDLEGLAKSYSELEKKFRAGKHKAPEGGKYDTSVLGEDISDDPLASAYVGWAAKYGLSQEAFDEMASQFGEIMGAQSEMTQQSAERERALLGPKADAIIQGHAQWARGLVQKGIWSADDFEEFKVWGGTAKGLNALTKLREAYEGRVPVESVPLEGAPSKDELYEMVGRPEYKTDPQYRRKVEKLFQQAFGS
jgi:hypothetical protein